MKVIVFGATGKIGQLATRQLLKDGHDVTGFARDTSKFGQLSSGMTAYAGDVFDPNAVSAAIKGHDAVLVVLGAGMQRKTTVRSTGTLNVIRGMQQHGVQRLICQSTLGTHESWENLNFFWKRIMFGAVLRPVFKDHELQEQMVRASGLNWTIVRPSAFDESPATGQFVEDVPTTARRLSLKISLEDLAKFLSRQVNDMRYLHRAVGIST